MLKKLLLIVIILLIAFAGYVATQPDDFRISREATIAAPADKIFEQVNSPRKMAVWSPWTKLDPNAKYTYEGPESGVGAATSWSGNMKLGEGKATIIESKSNEYIKTRLDFTKPMHATHNGEFTFKQEGDKTLVTWSMYGTKNFVGKAMGVIFNCNKMVGDMFEQGLQNLKTTVEKK